MVEIKRYVTGCSGGGEGLGAPALAVFDIDRKTAEFIIRMARLVKMHEISEIERYDFRTWYFETDPRDDLDDERRQAMEADPALIELDDDDENILRTDADRLSVTADKFHFLTYRRYCDVEIETEGQSIAELAACFDIPWDFKGPDRYLQARYGDGGEDPSFPRGDWQNEVTSGDTKLGYFEWLWHRYDAEGIPFPANAMGPAEKAADYVERLARRGIADTQLDDLVHDLKSAEAAGINNGGLPAQVKYLLEVGVSDALDSLLA